MAESKVSSPKDPSGVFSGAVLPKAINAQKNGTPKTLEGSSKTLEGSSNNALEGSSLAEGTIVPAGTVHYSKFNVSNEIELFDQIAERDHEQVVLCHDKRSGLRA